MTDKLYTAREAAEVYFQGKLSREEVIRLFNAGHLTGFRVGTRKGKILLYQSGLDAYRKANEQPPAPTTT